MNSLKRSNFAVFSLMIVWATFHAMAGEKSKGPAAKSDPIPTEQVNEGIEASEKKLSSDEILILESQAQIVLGRLKKEIESSTEVLAKAHGVLVFPDIVKAGMGVGGQYGKGLLQIKGKTKAAYEWMGASIGFQLGVEKRSIVFVFLTETALETFFKKSEWQGGLDGSATLVDKGVAGSLLSSAAKSPVLVFNLTPSGLMYNATIEGSRMLKL